MSKEYESEAMLEEKLITHLELLGYTRIQLKNLDDVKENFRKQVNKHNIEELKGKELSDKEFNRLYTMITGKGVFASSKILREKQCLERDNGEKIYIELFNTRKWCKNNYQVSNQITSITGEKETRYDITLLINGLPLIQIELKARGRTLKEAVNQIERYRRTSYKELYKFIQIYVISNGVNTKYFANADGEINFGYTFFWTDEKNNRISNLSDFSNNFLEKCFISKMIARYMVINETDKQLMVMRPYQVYAVEALVKQALETNNNGYIWHTTGSGKTLTSFKASQILSNEPNIKQVFFLVDRKDLDTQTYDEFNKFEPGSVDFTNSTYKLIKNIQDSTKPLIITTIQKMANAINNPKYSELMEQYKDEKVVFIIDECHRTQFGDMHKSIKTHFNQAQYFGFTGTPRLVENKSQDGRTTADIFEKCLHKYLLKDAIHDGNVLGFSVDYYKTIDANLENVDHVEVEGINTEETYMADERINNITEGILTMHPLKTNDMKYTALFATSSIPSLIKYYDCFHSKNTSLKIAAIYTYGPNEDYEGKDELSCQSLERIINDYNKMFDTNYSIYTFDGYFKDISKRVKNAEIDILIVVNMFLTGFDSKKLNTLYVDKFLKHHDLIQAFSRTNRVEKATKTQGNIVSFRTTKKEVDTAIKIFSETSNPNEVLLKPYEYYKEKFIEVAKQLKEMVPTVQHIDTIQSEEKIKKFIVIFRELTKILIKLKIFRKFQFTKEEVYLSHQEYLDYKSKYLDLATTKRSPNKVSILNDVDFELELMYTDKINVDYILNLIKSIDLSNKKQVNKEIKDILNKLENADSKDLRLKSDLIKEFLKKIVPTLSEQDSIEENYYNFMNKQRKKEIEEIAKKYNLDIELLNDIIGEYEYSNILDTNKLKEKIDKPLIEKVTITKQIKEFIENLINRF
ncbi:MAG: type I restriction endonuclease subunit R [Clostridia bacterium]|nr:type I restriction endonuclease subunit R [Clostridia bacterium]